MQAQAAQFPGYAGKLSSNTFRHVYAGTAQRLVFADRYIQERSFRSISCAAHAPSTTQPMMPPDRPTR